MIQVRPYAWTQNGQESRERNARTDRQSADFQACQRANSSWSASHRDARHRTRSSELTGVVFSEVPLAASTPRAAGFRISVAMDIPLYIEPVTPASAQVTWHLESTATGSRLIAANSGGRHFRLREVRLQHGAEVIHTLPRIVVLAKSTLAIELPETAKDLQLLRLIGQDDADQPVSIDIPAKRAQ